MVQSNMYIANHKEKKKEEKINKLINTNTLPIIKLACVTNYKAGMCMQHPRFGIMELTIGKYY